ncbi:expressed protein [Chlorella variabilis]|uniref:Expressed protein n=1 Tax=Chlorella variabilis TaxID=554065 RepID=E1Z971_CHLVA|nr:expressed protein [Chlorella variabilis]EFN57467.1 expressed protein [Chlorella variabilis]|eukprot:XP_005849569.1 expressed protein [Chlorella variabilis]
MAYVDRSGAPSGAWRPAGNGPPRALLAFVTGIVNFIMYFFRTILNPSAAQEYSGRSRRGGGGGGGPGGGPPRPPRGPRITGLSDLRDAGGAAACGAGG